jgi:hypothetical protein
MFTFIYWMFKPPSYGMYLPKLSGEHIVGCSTIAYIVSHGAFSLGPIWCGPLNRVQNLTPLGALVQWTLYSCTPREIASNNKTQRNIWWQARSIPGHFKHASKSRTQITPGGAGAACTVATWTHQVVNLRKWHLVFYVNTRKYRWAGIACSV